MTRYGRWREQIAENSARLAFAWGTVETTGIGTVLNPQPLMFGLGFINTPAVSYGAEYPDFDTAPDVDNDYAQPISIGFVHDWVWRSNICVGAYVGTTIQGADTDFDVIHHFTFAGIAVKKVLDGPNV